MNPQPLDPASLNCCSHRTPTGRRSHFPAFGNSALCSRYTPKHVAQTEADLTANFGKQLLSSPQRAANINAFLARLAILVVQSRISPRRAAVLAYVSNLLLRSLPEIDRSRKRHGTLAPQARRPSGPICRRASNSACRLHRSMRRYGIDGTQ